ncbi:MAG: permease [Opitutales bacterium]
MFEKLANILIYQLLGLDPESRSGAALHFFVYDVLKIFFLLFTMVFVIGFVRTWLPEHRLKKWMGRGGLWGNLFAAVFGAVTPFCSCSSIPLFISLLKAGVPLGVTFSFLVTSPIINEYLVILMAGEFGVPITVAYVASGLTIGTLAGAILGKMGLERMLEKDITSGAEPVPEDHRYTLFGRLKAGFDESVSVVKQVWIWVIVGVGAGALIHNFVPEEFIHGMMQATGVFSVPLATVLGVPMYGSCATIVPIAAVLFEKGIPLGTALAFMMAMSALSLPEAIMLRRVMLLPLIALYFAITTLAIIGTGYLLNALAPLLS